MPPIPIHSLAPIQTRTKRDLHFQGHRTLRFNVCNQTTPAQDQSSSPMTLQNLNALHQFAKTLLKAFPNVHLMETQLGHSAIIITVNPLQKKLDLFYTDLIKHFLPHAIQLAEKEMAKSQPEDEPLSLYLESSVTGSLNEVDMPSGVQPKWKNWLAAAGLTPKTTEPESPIGKIEPFAMTLNIGSQEPMIQKLEAKA